MSYNDIVPLSQKDPLASVEKNGQYSINIQNNIAVEKGDNVIMRSCFLDTSAFDSQQIILDTDTTLEFDFTEYIMHNQTFTNAISGRTDIQWDNVLGKTGLPLFECKYVAQDLNKVIVDSINFFKNIDGSFSGWGGITTTIQYKTWDGTTTSTHFRIPPFTSDSGILSYKISGLSIHAEDNSIKDITPPALVKKGKYVPVDNVYSTGQTIEVVLQPVILTHTITLSKGVYQPDEISAVITEKAQNARNANIFYPNNEALNAAFLSEVSGQPPIESMTCAGPATYLVSGTNEPYPVDIKFQGTGYWKGASQVVLEYDNAINKFFWSFLHTPAYGGVTGSEKEISLTRDVQAENIPSIPFEQNPTGDQNFYNQSGGGIVFHSLRAYDDKNQLIDFWEGKLGFDLSSLCFQNIFTGIRYFPAVSGAPGLLGTWNYPSYENFKTGQCVTTPEIIADMGIVKGAAYQSYGELVDSLPTNTDKIYATNQVLEANLSTGFYFIDVIAEFQNSISNSINTFKHTVGIVSNYFNQNSFTTGTSGDSLIYTHNSDTELVLSSFQIRILDSLRSDPANLGENNHIFLEIVHNPSPVDLLLEQTEAEVKVKEMEKISKSK